MQRTPEERVQSRDSLRAATTPWEAGLGTRGLLGKAVTKPEF